MKICCNVAAQMYEIFLPRLLLLSFMSTLLLSSEVPLSLNPLLQFKRIRQNPQFPQVVLHIYLKDFTVTSLCCSSICRMLQSFFYIPDIPVASPSFSYGRPSGDTERIIPQDHVTEAPSDSELCRAIKGQSTDETPSPPPAVQFSSRLSELDAQLAALQNIADNLETDFLHSRTVHQRVLLLGC